MDCIPYKMIKVKVDVIHITSFIELFCNYTRLVLNSGIAKNIDQKVTSNEDRTGSILGSNLYLAKLTFKLFQSPCLVCPIGRNRITAR